jgi:SnoaL-like domain
MMHVTEILSSAAVFAVALPFLAGCTMQPSQSNADQTALIEKLTARVQHLEDVQEIEKLQAKYTQYLFTQKYDRIVDECFAQHVDDVTVEFSDSGVYKGLDHIRALYAAFMKTKQIPGFFIMHMTVDPYIEISKDGKTARSNWLSPGITGSNTSAGWVWGPYYVDYVKEDGHWRITHTNLAALVRTNYETSWAKATDNGTVRGVLGVEPDAPSTIYKPYAERKTETDMFKDFPDLPKPF